MHILIANDDGITAPGIFALVNEIEKYHEVTIVAPSEQKSASSHSITLNRPLTVKEHKLSGLKSKAFSVDGTPADCVRIALDKLVDKKVDIVMSGINRGYNLGMDILYSGTVSAAVEASINKIPSIAISTDQFDTEEEYRTAAQYARIVLEKATERKLKNDVVLNLNVPPMKAEEIKGIMVCRIGNMVYGNYFVERINSDAISNAEHKIYDIMGNIYEPEGTDMDTFYISQGYATVTPLHYDLTNFKILQEVGSWF